MDTFRPVPLKLSGLLLVLFALLFIGCKKNNKIVKIDPEFSKYIEAYTTGVISKKSTIRIQLTSDVSTTHTLNETIKDDLFDFSPSIKGKAYWTDERTIEFKPEKDLQADQLYEIEFNLAKVRKVPSKFSKFTFNVQVIKPSFIVQENGLRAVQNSKDLMTLTGSVLTADVEDSKQVEKMIQIKAANGTPVIKWQHNETNKTHDFTIDGIKRGSTGSALKIVADGSPLNISNHDERDVQVPAVGSFVVLGVRPIQQTEEYVLVQFSDPLAINQDLHGLITVSEQEDVSYTINGSEVKVYVPNRLDGSYKVNINEGITNEWGTRLNKSFAANAFFENRLPQVKIHGRGTILPNSGGKIVLPFEATNLKAVDVSIVKILENNVSQFLQINKLDGESEIRRVAKPLVQATIKLDEDQSLNLHKKNRFSLDIDKYIRTEPGAIYRVNIGFRPEYSLYTCVTTDSSKEEEEEYYNEWGDEGSDNGVDEDDEFWNRYDNYYPYGYNWDQKDNPCSRSYFNKEHFDSRNIIATNIGLTAKRGSNNQLFIAATNIISTEPMNGVDLQILDYQRQVIAKGTSGSDGFANIELKQKPFLLVAKKGDEKSYLKLDDGTALPLSRFEVSGTEVKNGIKGFIFGERGVWRPGDSLYLSCIIEDKENKLPDDHPIEMELYSPTGQLYKKLVQTNAADGFNVFRTSTDASAPTGNWNCKVKIGGAVFEKKLKIETVMPNRLKIDLNFGNDPQLGKGITTTGTLSAKWLFGATVKNLKAKVDASLYKTKTTFPKFEAYTFDNPTAAFETQSKTIFDGALSEDGTATINPNFEITTQAPGVLNANLLVKVFEPGGNFSIDNVSYPFHPFTSYAGIRVPEGTKPWGYLAAGKPHSIDVVDVNTQGTPIAGASMVQVELYKVQWRWWWDNSGDNLSNFTQDEYNKLIEKRTVGLTNGKGVYNFNISSENWGRYLVLVRDMASGHVTGETFYVDDPYWQNRDNKDDPTAAAMLSFTSDKTKYNVGDDVKLSIPTSKGGRALISIENGTGVVKTYWTETQQGQTTFSFTAEKEMTPNVYVNVSLLQPHAQTINDLPIRMYGVIPVLIEDKKTILKPVIKMPDVIRPEQQTSITVSEANSNDMSYVIAVVDEGLLDLTRFKTPDPHKAFYSKEALGVKSWDVFDYVIGAWGGDLERILTIGGDNEGDGAGPKKANRFKPIVQFMGPFTSNGGSKTHTFTLPAYMGSVRTMVIAANEGAYGFAEKAVAVKKPLMLLGTIPRVLGPGERIRIPVTVFATERNIKNVSLSLENNALLAPAGSTTQNISFTTTGEQQVYFDAVVKASTGVGKIRLIATSGKERAAYEVELDVRNPNPAVTSVIEKTLQPNQNINTIVAAMGNGNSSKAVVEISSIPAINLEKRLQYLIQYPHGCIEQITSSVFPQLVLNQLMELNGQQKAQVDMNIRKGIEKIKNFQTPDGGFSYWPGNTGSDEWGTNYAGNFLLEASERGYNVPSNMLQQWRSYERSRANAWNQTAPVYYGGDLVQAYRLYLLALAKAPELGAMNRLKEYRFITPEAKWRLAAAYHLMGQTGVALQLISGLPTNFSQRSNPGITFGSQLRDQAMVLETLTIMNRKGEAERLVRAVAQQLSQESWYSTQTTAYSLIAIAKFSGKNASGSRLIIDGTVGSQKVNVNSSSPLTQLPVTFANRKSNVSLTNKGSNVLYVRIINSGQPIAGDSLRIHNNPNVLTMNVNFISNNGTSLDPSTITQGTDFVAKVTVKNTGQRGTYDQMALSQIFPSGWEILNTRLYNSEGTYKSSPYEYMDIRDDRVYHYFDIRQNETRTYYVQLNAAYPGRFYWPGTYCEAMYDNSISAGVNGKWVEVKQ
jgi:alpha-2-macroglobulin